jgi:hypothetical protein
MLLPTADALVPYKDDTAPGSSSDQESLTTHTFPDALPWVVMTPRSQEVAAGVVVLHIARGADLDPTLAETDRVTYGCLSCHYDHHFGQLDQRTFAVCSHHVENPDSYWMIIGHPDDELTASLGKLVSFRKCDKDGRNGGVLPLNSPHFLTLVPPGRPLIGEKLTDICSLEVGITVSPAMERISEDRGGEPLTQDDYHRLEPAFRFRMQMVSATALPIAEGGTHTRA